MYAHQSSCRTTSSQPSPDPWAAATSARRPSTGRGLATCPRARPGAVEQCWARTRSGRLAADWSAAPCARTLQQQQHKNQRTMLVHGSRETSELTLVLSSQVQHEHLATVLQSARSEVRFVECLTQSAQTVRHVERHAAHLQRLDACSDDVI